MTFGGEGHDEQNANNARDDHVPFTISATDDRIGVVGYHYWEDRGANNLADPTMAVVNAFDGTILDFAIPRPGVRVRVRWKASACQCERIGHLARSAALIALEPPVFSTSGGIRQQ